MTNRKHIAKPKKLLTSTDWKNGNVPKKNAPFFRAIFPLANPWNWREANLESKDGIHYRLLVMYRADSKLNYKAWLSIKLSEKKYALVCRYESHSNHGGRHCHLLCGEEHYPIGEIEPKGLGSFPNWRNTTQPRLSAISLNEAWNWALKFYRIGVDTTGTLI